MKIRTEALLGATMFGTVIMTIYSIISAITTYNNINAMLNNEPLNAVSSLLGILGCFILLIGGIGTGIIYPILHSRQEAVQVAAKGGAAAGALAFTISGFISGIIFMVLFIPLFNEISRMLAQDPTLAGSGADQLVGAGAIGGVIGMLCGTLVSAGIGAILGVIGGLIGGAFAKGNAPTAASATSEFDF